MLQYVTQITYIMIYASGGLSYPCLVKKTKQKKKLHKSKYNTEETEGKKFMWDSKPWTTPERA